MDANSLRESKADNFGAAAAGLILLSVLIAYLFVSSIISVFLDIAWIEAALSVQSRSANEVAALRRISGGILGPCLMFFLTLGLLKVSFPRQSMRALLALFGLQTLSNIKTLAAYFLAGAALVLLFSKVLAAAFPPPVVAAAHPANIVNYGSTFEKLLFALSVVVLAPIAEEFLFRGVLYSGFASTWKKPIAALAVSISFILIHPETISSGYWLTHLLLVLISFILILVREATHTVVTCILFHAGVNFAILFS